MGKTNLRINLHHDNVTRYTLDQRSYSLDLATSNLILVPHIKINLEEQPFSTAKSESLKKCYEN